MSLYIGVDSGTQSTKAIVLDLERGRVIAEARAPHRLIAGLPAGHMEQHPRDWARALERVLSNVAAQIDGSRVRGVGISGQQHGFVPLDANGQVIRPAKLWCDTSTTEECALLTHELGGPAAVIRETGLPFLPGYTAPKILWLKRHEPANFRRLRHVLLPHDYLNYHLTGNYFMEAGDASGTALLDVRRRTWSPSACAAIDPNLQEWLPPISPSHSAAGVLRPALAKKLGFASDVVVSAGGGDNMMAAIGTGNVQAGVVTCSLGTSGTIFATNPSPIVDPQGEIAAFCSSTGNWLPLLCTMNVTLVTELLRGLFGAEHRAYEAALRKTSPGAGGLLLLPYLAGERTPNLPSATGTLAGLTTQNLSRDNLLRSGIEGVTLGLGYGLDRLRELGVKPAEIRLTGGGARSAAWRQVAADVFGVPTVTTVAPEAGALGGALQAAWCVAGGKPATLAKLCRQVVQLDERTRVRPRAAAQRVYRDALARQAQLREKLHR